MKNLDFDSDDWIRRSRDSSTEIRAELKEELKELVGWGEEEEVCRKIEDKSERGARTNGETVHDGL